MIWLLVLVALKWSPEGAVLYPHTKDSRLELVSPSYTNTVIDMATTFPTLTVPEITTNFQWFKTKPQPPAVAIPRVLTHQNIMSLFLEILEWSPESAVILPNIYGLSTWSPDGAAVKPHINDFSTKMPLPPPLISPRVVTHLNIMRIVALLVHSWSPEGAAVNPHIDGLPTEIQTPPVPDICEGCFINSSDITSDALLLSHIASPLQSNYDDNETPLKHGIKISAETWPTYQHLTVHRNSSGSSSNLIQFSTYLAMQLHSDTEVCNILHSEATNRINICKWILPEPRSPIFLTGGQK